MSERDLELIKWSWLSDVTVRFVNGENITVPTNGIRLRGGIAIDQRSLKARIVAAENTRRRAANRAEIDGLAIGDDYVPNWEPKGAARVSDYVIGTVVRNPTTGERLQVTEENPDDEAPPTRSKRGWERWDGSSRRARAELERERA